MYQGMRKVHFSENLVCSVFLSPMFWDSHFCVITDKLYCKLDKQKLKHNENREMLIICSVNNLPWNENWKGRAIYDFDITFKILKRISVNFKQNYIIFHMHKWDKVFKNGPSKICRRQPLKSFTWSILECSVLNDLLLQLCFTNIFDCTICVV